MKMLVKGHSLSLYTPEPLNGKYTVISDIFVVAQFKNKVLP